MKRIHEASDLTKTPEIDERMLSDGNPTTMSNTAAAAKHPTITIVLPTHNGRKYIDQSVESVIRQTRQDWELIIVDDASTDDTPARIDWWAEHDSRIAALHLARNRTLPGALNEGFRRARGTFHTWTSDDNWYHRDALTRMADSLEDEPQIGVVYTDLTHANEFGTPLAVSETGRSEQLWEGNCIGACFLYRRDVFYELKGYDETLFGAEDYDFWLRAALHFRFKRLAEPLYYYRFQKGSISIRKYRLVVANVEKAIRRWLPQIKWPDETTRLRAYIKWGERCLMANTWGDVYEPWLREATWLDAAMRQHVRREVLKQASRLAWEAHWSRRWDDFERYRTYLSEVSDDPEVHRLLTSRFYPRWVYRTKDCLWNLSDRLQARLRRDGFKKPDRVV